MTENRVSVNINGQDYPMVCAPGEEEKVLALGEKINDVVRQIASVSGPISEARLLVMAALILTDRLTELENNTATGNEPASDNADEDKIASVLENLASRLETLASGD